jgi:hypothetical protein
MMPTITACALAIAFVIPLLAGSPMQAAEMSVEELLRKHAAACGGDRWNEVRSLEMTGTATIFSIQAPFRVLRMRPGSYRFERVIQENEVVSVFDGRSAWWNNPGMGFDWPVPVPLPEAAILRREADFDGPLLNHDTDGQRIELLGPGDLDGEKGWELKVTWRDGAEERWFLDPGTYLPIGRVSPDADYGRPREKITFFSDYREVGGLMLPHLIEMEYGTRHEILAIESVSIDAEQKADAFRMPPPDGMEPFASLAGEWDLTIETRSYPQAPWEENRAQSTITPLLGGRMLEERFAWVTRGVPIDIIRTLSYDCYREVYRITRIDSFTGQQDVLEGVFEDGRLSATNIRSGTVRSDPEQPQHTRLSLFEIEADRFRIGLEDSTDGGESWTENARYTYTRR